MENTFSKLALALVLLAFIPLISATTVSYTTCGRKSRGSSSFHFSIVFFNVAPIRAREKQETDKKTRTTAARISSDASQRFCYFLIFSLALKLVTVWEWRTIQPRVSHLTDVVVSPQGFGTATVQDVRITPCSDPRRCVLKKNTNVAIEIDYTPSKSFNTASSTSKPSSI